MMNEFQEAEITNTEAPAGPGAAQPALTDMTTDDLVLMIGESQINLRQNTKIIRHLQTQLQACQTELAKAASRLATQDDTIKAYEARFQSADASNHDAAAAAKKQADSLHQRIVDLENQLYQTAQERDKAVADLSTALDAAGNKTRRPK